MAFITLASVDYEIQTAGATEVEPAYVGEMSRSGSGQLRSGRRARKRSWQFTLIPLIQADYATFIAAIGVDATLTATGDALSGASIPVIVTMTGSAYIQSGTGFLRVVSVLVQEI